MHNYLCLNVTGFEKTCLLLQKANSEYARVSGPL